MKPHKQKRRNKDSPSRKNQIDKVVENLIAQIENNLNHVWQIGIVQI